MPKSSRRAGARHNAPPGRSPGSPHRRRRSGRSAWATVCGINATSKPASSTSLTVRLTPSTQIEPFLAMYLSSAAGAPKRQRCARASSCTDRTWPRPSTWPLTKCPPRRSLGRIARSRFSTAPSASWPSVVRARVSVEASAWNRARVERDHGQADAVDGDTFAELDVVERQAADLEGETQVAALRLASGQAADAFNDAGEHQRASRGRMGSNRTVR